MKGTGKKLISVDRIKAALECSGYLIESLDTVLSRRGYTKVFMCVMRTTSLGFLSLLLVACKAPTTPDQFWWNWWINAAVAMATFLAVLAALGGPLLTEVLRSKWFPPVFRLYLLSAEGEKGKNRYNLNDGKGERVEARRFYHVRVLNERRRLSPAQGVQVSLLRVEEPGPGGSLQMTWAGDIPLTWRNQQLSPLTRTIGHDYDCDLCSVGEEQGLSLALLIFPYNLNAIRKQACTIIVSLQAKGTQADSSTCRIEIAWDGKWEDGDSEMKRHLVIKQIADSTT